MKDSALFWLESHWMAHLLRGTEAVGPPSGMPADAPISEPALSGAPFSMGLSLRCSSFSRPFAFACATTTAFLVVGSVGLALGLAGAAAAGAAAAGDVATPGAAAEKGKRVGSRRHALWPWSWPWFLVTTGSCGVE